MRAVWVAVMMVGLSGPALAWGGDDPAITACEAAIKSVLRSPRSYERVSARVDGPAAIVEYEAQNAYGVFIRSEQICRFEETDGSWEISRADTDIAVTSREDDPTSERQGASWHQQARQRVAAEVAGLTPIEAGRTILKMLPPPPQPPLEERLSAACADLLRRDYRNLRDQKVMASSLSQAPATAEDYRRALLAIPEMTSFDARGKAAQMADGKVAPVKYLVTLTLEGTHYASGDRRQEAKSCFLISDGDLLKADDARALQIVE